MGNVQPFISVLTIGDELLSGDVTDLNLSTIAKAIGETGFDIKKQVTIGDNLAGIANSITNLCGESDVLITTGGLGPTSDDLTREAVSFAFGRPLVFREELAKLIEDFFGSLGRNMSPENLKQAYIPEEAKVIPPAGGTAPGFIIEHEGTMIACLPGVPREMKSMLINNVIPEIKKRHVCSSFKITREILTFGAGESDIANMLKTLACNQEVSYGFLAWEGIIKVKISAEARSKEEAQRILDLEEMKVREALGPLVFGVDGESMEEVVSKLLLKRDKTISVAESCTAGMVSSRIANVSGSSSYFKGGVVTYSIDSKRSILGISREILSRGVVSKEVAEAMATSVKKIFDSDIGLGITGVAGPKSIENKAPGTICIGLATPEEVFSWEIRFPGDRNFVRRIASTAALNAIRLSLIS